jgi:hypothetical protein
VFNEKGDLVVTRRCEGASKQNILYILVRFHFLLENKKKKIFKTTNLLSAFQNK